MQIQLRQSEIEEALKQYVAKIGINLQGKTVEIAFTAGRKEAGMSADISVEDPGYVRSETPVVEMPNKPILAVANTKPEPPPVADAQAEAKAETKAETKVAGTSLFGG